jgi:hypothetical protein
MSMNTWLECCKCNMKRGFSNYGYSKGDYQVLKNYWKYSSTYSQFWQVRKWVRFDVDTFVKYAQNQWNISRKYHDCTGTFYVICCRCRGFVKLFGFILLVGAHGSIIDWGIMLQAGRSQDQILMRWIFSIYLILPAALWPWGRLSLYEYQEYSWG